MELRHKLPIFYFFRMRIYWVLVLAFCLSITTVSAIGLQHQKVGTITYQPGLELDIPIGVRNFNHEIEITVGGDFSRFGTLGPITDGAGGSKDVTLHIKFPNNLDVEPGLHVISVQATEIGTVEGTVSALTSIRKNFKVEVYSKEKDINVEFSAPDANQHEKVDLTIGVQSWTYEDIFSVYGEIAIYDADNNEVSKIQTQRTSLKSGDSVSLLATLDTANLKPGTYNAEAMIFYDGETKVISDEFKIGTLMIKITGATSAFQSGQIQEVLIDVESVWNNPIHEIYGEFYVAGENVLQTASIDLGSWEAGTLSGYWNVSLPPGNYDAVAEVHFEDVESTKKVTITVSKSLKVGGINMWIVGTVGSLLVIIIILIAILLRTYNKTEFFKKKK